MFARSPVEASAVLPGGHAVSGVEELKQYLNTQQRERVARALVQKVLAYGLGRSLEYTDAAEVDALVKDLKPNDYRITEMITRIALCHTFNSK